MSENLSGTYNTVQTLSAATPHVTVSGTINAYGTVGTYSADINGPTTFTAKAALFGPSSGNFTITNSGLVETHGPAADEFDVGIVLGAAGTVRNSGTILGGSGIAVFQATGASYVENSNLIEGSIGVGVVIFGTTSTSGTVANSGTIINTATGGSGGGAIAIFGDGYVTNTSGGTLISDGAYVINGQSGPLSVTNAGVLIGYYGGINLKGGGFVTNAGTIQVTGTGTTGSNSSYAGVNSNDGGTIFNSGTILGQNGIYAGYGNGAVTGATRGYIHNSGLIDAVSAKTIQNAGTGNVLGDGIILRLPGTVVNAGSITASNAGIYTQNGTAIVFNEQGRFITAQVGIDLSRNSNGGTPLAAVGYVGNFGVVQAFSSIDINGNFANGFNTVGVGVYLGASGTVANFGTIAGNHDGIVIENGLGFVLNEVVVTSSNGYGVYLNGGGILGNFGDIFGYRTGVRAKNVPVSIVNSGFIDATGSTFSTGGSGSGNGLPTGFYFSHGIEIGNGSITNTSAGTVIGQSGIVINGSNSGGYILNTGHVTATGHAGLYLKSSGTLVNSGTVTAYRSGLQLNNGGTIINTGFATGKTGIDIGSLNAATVENSGTITGTNGIAIDFANISGSSILRDDPGAVFNGTVENADGLGYLELEYGATAGTLDGFGTLFTGFSYFEVTGGAVWDIAGTTSINAAITLLNDGTLAETAADTLAIGGALIGNGAIDLDLTTVALAGSVGAGQQISFGQAGSDLVLGDAGQFNGSIQGFTAGDTIELSGIPFTSTGGAYGAPGEDTYTVATAGTLSVDADGTVYNLLIAGATIGQDNFVLSNDLAITETACYAKGTHIATAVGEIEVEDLEIGDHVETLNGSLQKIKWIGKRSYDGRFIAGNKDVLPIRIAKGAIGEQIPARDLYVSPGHAICIDGALIHAFRLVNGVSITQIPSVESVTYYHIETENHDVIFAENCPAETFLDENFRAQFQNAAEYRALYPGQIAAKAACLPLLEDGFELHAILQRLNARAGLPRPAETHGTLRGYVDEPGPIFCTGWAQDAENPETPVCLDILAGGKRAGQVLANLYRSDLRQAGLGSGCHAFRVALPAGLTGRVEIRRAADGAELAWTEAALARAA